jgi:hypothetical protein
MYGLYGLMYIMFFFQNNKTYHLRKGIEEASSEITLYSLWIDLCPN